MARCVTCSRPFAGRAVVGPHGKAVCEGCFAKQFPGKVPMPVGNRSAAMARLVGQYHKVAHHPRTAALTRNSLTDKKTRQRNETAFQDLPPGSYTVKPMFNPR